MINQTLIWSMFLQLLYFSALKQKVLAAGPFAIPLLNEGLQYHAEISLGTPPQTLLASFDTGSTDLIVLTSETQSEEKKDGKLFNPYASTSFKEMPERTCSSKFGDGTQVSGYVATEVLEVGEGNSRVQVKVLVCVAHSTVNGGFYGANALLGLAFNLGSTLEPTKIIAPLESIISQAVITPCFSYYPMRTKEGQNSGELYFGGENTNRKSEFLGKVSVAPKDNFYVEWGFSLDRMEVGGNNLKMDRIIGIPDSGSVTITFPKAVMDFFLQRSGIDADLFSKNAFLCSSLPNDLPKITLITSNDIRLSLGPEDYIQQARGGGGLVCQPLISILEEVDKVILGTPFLQKYYTTFDYENAEMTFATADQPLGDTRNEQPGKAAKDSEKILGPEFVNKAAQFIRDNNPN